jgi:hypothetical protein
MRPASAPVSRSTPLGVPEIDALVTLHLLPEAAVDDRAGSVKPWPQRSGKWYAQTFHDTVSTFSRLTC